MSANQPALFRFLRAYAWRYLPLYGLGLAALLATNYINVLIPEFVQRAIDALGQGAPHREIQVATLFLGGLALAVVVTRTLSRILFFNPGRTIEFRLKNTFFHHLMRMPLRFFQSWKTGELISRGTNDMTYVRSVIGFATLQLMNVFIALTLAVYKMAVIDAWMTFLCVGPFLVGVIILRRGIRLLLTRFRLAQTQLAELSSPIMDSYTGVAVIQGFNAQKTFGRRMSDKNQEYVKNFESMIFLRSFHLPVVTVTGSACLVILLLVGGERAMEGHLTVGQLSAYASYLGIVVASLTSTGWMINSIQRGLIGLKRIYEVLDKESAFPPSTTLPAGSSTPLQVEVHDLNFAFESHSGHFSMENISFRLEPGETLGLFGPTGSGKSTLLSLLARLHPAPKGSVLFDQKDLAEWSEENLRSRTALVPQSSYLFSRTVRENIAFADLRTQVQEDRVQQAIELACFHEDLAHLSEGLHTQVGERGVTLSGGQRQRIALARAFYKDFGLLLLDDVLSAVDHETEQRLIEGIRKRTADFTTIIASHRVTALVHATEILVLDDGKIVDRGTHEELVSRPGLYAKTWALHEEGEK